MDLALDLLGIIGSLLFFVGGMVAGFFLFRVARRRLRRVTGRNVPYPAYFGAVAIFLMLDLFVEFYQVPASFNFLFAFVVGPLVSLGVGLLPGMIPFALLFLGRARRVSKIDRHL